MSLENMLHNLELLKKQISWLKISYDQATAIGLKEVFEVNEFGVFEILSSRFSRSIDFLIRKMFRSIDDYEFENQGTLVDVINNAHKRNLFSDIQEIRIIKEIRNSIAHEYIEDALNELFEDVLRYTPKLLTIMNNTVEYIENQ